MKRILRSSLPCAISTANLAWTVYSRATSETDWLTLALAFLAGACSGVLLITEITIARRTKQQAELRKQQQLLYRGLIDQLQEMR